MQGEPGKELQSVFFFGTITDIDLKFGYSRWLKGANVSK